MRFLIIFCPATDTTFMSNSQHNHNVAKELSPEIGVSSLVVLWDFSVSVLENEIFPFGEVDQTFCLSMEHVP